MLKIKQTLKIYASYCSDEKSENGGNSTSWTTTTPPQALYSIQDRSRSFLFTPLKLRLWLKEAMLTGCSILAGLLTWLAVGVCTGGGKPGSLLSANRHLNLCSTLQLSSTLFHAFENSSLVFASVSNAMRRNFSLFTECLYSEIFDPN